MILEFMEKEHNKLWYKIKYSNEVDGYIEEDNIVGYLSKNIKEIMEILRIIKQLPIGLKENIIQKILIEEYKHKYIIAETSREIDYIYEMIEREYESYEQEYDYDILEYFSE